MNTRNVTVSFADGSKHVYNNVPADITPDQVTQRASQDFAGLEITNLDGGAKAPSSRARTSSPTNPPVRARQQVPVPSQTWVDRLQNVSPAQARTSYNRQRQAITSRYADPAQRAAALNAYDNSEAGVALRYVAGGRTGSASQAPSAEQIAAPQNRKERAAQMRSVGRQAATGSNSGIGRSAEGGLAGAARGAFGLPEHLAAGIHTALGSGGRDLSYSDRLNIIRGVNDQEMQEAPVSGLVGQIAGGALSGLGAAGAVRGAGGALVASGAPAAQRVGNVLQTLTTLERGGRTGAAARRTRNIGRIATAGAAGGGAQAAGEGSDIVTGAAIGAVAAPALEGAVQGARALGRGGLRGLDVFRQSPGSVSRAMRDVIEESPDTIAARQADLSRRTGTNVPLVAALNDADFREVAKRVVEPNTTSVQRAGDASTRYLNGFMDRMTRHVSEAGNAANTPQVTLGGLRQSRTDMANKMMQPYRNRDLSLDDLDVEGFERDAIRQIGGRTLSLRERINQAFTDLTPQQLEEAGLSGMDSAAARRLAREWGLSSGSGAKATVQELDGLRRSLNAAAKSSDVSNPENAMAYRNAADQIGDFISERVPAYREMLDNYAAASRVIEGFDLASQGRRVSDLADDQLRRNAQTPEGAIGRQMGELFRQRTSVGKSMSGAVQSAKRYAEGGDLTRVPTGQANAARPGTITENMGASTSRALQDVSEAETQILNRFLDSDKLESALRGNPEGLSVSDIAYTALLFNPNSMLLTKSNIVGRLLEKLPTGINPRVADNITDMLFSGDAKQTQEAISAMRRVGAWESVAQAFFNGALNRASVAGNLATSGLQDEGRRQGAIEETEAVVYPPEASFTGGDAGGGMEEVSTFSGEVGNGPYSQGLAEMYQTYSPRLLELTDLMAQAESGNRQTDDQGRTIRSPKGAAGVMQLMPDTAPDAARMAGLPWDEEAYLNDSDYNRQLGIAYFANMLDSFDGDVEKALAAYNYGPGNVRRLLQSRGDAWQDGLPEETRDYLDKILGA